MRAIELKRQQAKSKAKVSLGSSSHEASTTLPYHQPTVPIKLSSHDEGGIPPLQSMRQSKGADKTAATPPATKREQTRSPRLRIQGPLFPQSCMERFERSVRPALVKQLDTDFCPRRSVACAVAVICANASARAGTVVVRASAGARTRARA